MTRVHKLVLVIVVSIFFGALYFAADIVAEKRAINSSQTSFSKKSAGVSIFSDFKNALDPDSIRVHRKPFLFAKDFDGIDSIFILSPLTQVSGREAKTVLEQVRSGKTLVLSFHDEATLKNIFPLLAGVSGIGIRPDVDPGFKNKATFSAESNAVGRLVREGERYEFYSLLRFAPAGDDTACRLEPLVCYMREFPLDKGHMIVFAGLPPFGNVLISRADNKRLAYRLAKTSGRALFDEYHHFFSEKTTADLWVNPTFLFPVLGFVIGTLLYFLFAHTEMRSRLKRKNLATVARRTYHDLNREILLNLLGRENATSSAVAKQAEFLMRLYPEEREKLEGIRQSIPGNPVEAMRFGTRLLLMHQSFLKRKGRKTK